MVVFLNAVLIFASSIVASAFAWIFIAGPYGVPSLFKKRNLYRGTPIAKFKLAGIPLVSVTGAVTAGYILFSVYAFFSYHNFGLNTRFMEFLSFGLNLVVVFLYFVIREYKRRSSNIDVRYAFEEIPPA